MAQLTYLTYHKDSSGSWWPIRESQVRDDAPAHEVKRRSYEIARGLYPSSVLKTVLWTKGYTAPDSGPEGEAA